MRAQRLRHRLLAALAGVATTATFAAAETVVEAGATDQDPRRRVTELQVEGRTSEALAAVELILEENPEESGELGFHHLRGAMLESLGRLKEAQDAFAQAIGANPELSSYSRYRLALLHLFQGHPEVATGLLAGLLSGGPPERLVAPATELFVRSLAAGGDCRLLRQVDSWKVPEKELRRLQLARSDCDSSSGHVEAAVSRLLALVQSNGEDESARGAAERLSRLQQSALPERELALLVGHVFHRHRQFDLSIRFLERGLEPLGANRPPAEGSLARPSNSPAAVADREGESLYALARSHFWQENYLLAASHFGRLAASIRSAEEKGRALYQQGRSYELSGKWGVANQSYRLGYLEDVDGRWADANLISALRVDWRRGREDQALSLYEVLGSRRDWRRLHGRAALFLASSDLVRERTDRAAAWLADADGAPGKDTGETDYWQGRLAELENRPQDAVESYLGVLTATRSHPFAQGAATRLRTPKLAPVAEGLGRRLARSERSSSLYHAWLLLGDAHPEGADARRRLVRELKRGKRARSLLEIGFRPVREWPLWTAPLRQPEEMLLALGLWAEGAPAVRKHFPLDDPSLGLTASRLLSQAGAHRDSLRIAEILEDGAEDTLPAGLLPVDLLRLLFPRPYATLITQEAANYAIDPDLLTALIREESRFDPLAVSGASARGLTQLVLPTASRLAPAFGRRRISAAELHDPEVSIALGAAYLSELGQRFDEFTPEVVAAYNAGERQAELWLSYCYSRQPEEYLSKVGFPETRAYLGRVLSTRQQYASLYGNDAD
ncbi:MAG: lytic transglycosylase domain-containing protein [Acidobacteriota bacterium]|nr:lytic transglycosylase domain-containing protein [Acidobacteriota bacterium]